MTERERAHRCRLCASELKDRLLDLGPQPDPDQLLAPGAVDDAPTAPVDLWICSECGLVQLVGPRPSGATPAHGHHPPRGGRETTDQWLQSLVARIPAGGLVIDLDHDDPATGDGAAALMTVGHALSHVDDLDAFLSGLLPLLAPDGRLVFEFHHVLGLAQGQVDVLSHAHRSYLSLHAVEALLARHDLVALAAERVEAFGGTVRVAAGRPPGANRDEPGPGASSIDAIRAIERDARLTSPATYVGLANVADRVGADLRAFLDGAVRNARTVAGYGAAARGAVLLNIAGIDASQLSYVADRSPRKQGRWLPGSRIPVVSPDEIAGRRPDDILILPWPLAPEITAELAYARTWGARFLVAMPRLEILP